GAEAGTGTVRPPAVQATPDPCPARQPAAGPRPRRRPGPARRLRGSTVDDRASLPDAELPRSAAPVRDRGRGEAVTTATRPRPPARDRRSRPAGTARPGARACPRPA